VTIETPEPGELDEHIEVQAGRRAPFTQVGDWVLISGVSDRAVALYSRLAMHVNTARGDTEVWPAQEVLAEWANLSKPESITPYLDELAAIGAITVERMQYAGGLRTRNRYTVHQTPTPDYTGPVALADYYRMRREHPEDLKQWRAERQAWITAQVKLIAERRKAGGKSTVIPARRRAPFQRGTQRPAGSRIVTGEAVPRSRAVRTPAQRGPVPLSSGVELYEVEQDESPLSQAALERPRSGAPQSEREIYAAPPKNRPHADESDVQPTAARRVVRASGAVPLDQESAFIAWVTAKHQVRSPGFWRACAADIPELAAAWRADGAATTRPATSAIPPWCGNCGDNNPAAKFNPRFRYLGEDCDLDREQCPDCHPDVAARGKDSATDS
jgi:hypothetical protein